MKNQDYEGIENAMPKKPKKSLKNQGDKFGCLNATRLT
jgi:hypothetical protein